MSMSEEMNKMLEVIKENDFSLRNNNSMYKSYLAPDIPEKVMKKLLKYYDSHLPIKGVLAFYDETLFSSCKSGVVFTNDGFYVKFMSKPVYIHYADITHIYVDSSKNLVVDTSSDTMSDYTIITAFDKYVFKNILEKLIKIDSEYGQSSFKTSGQVKKIDIPEDMMKKCHGIIHAASVACGGVGTGLAQIPASDNAVIVPIQIGMIVGLGAVFELNITESAAKSIIASAGATVAGRTASQFLVGWIPVIGNAINTATAAGITEAIGWIAVTNFYERWLEDKNKGRFEAMKEGYSQASGEYERKLRRQAEEFLNQKKTFQKERDEYEKLLSEYEAYIEELEKKCAALEVINEMKEIYDNLKSLKVA